MATSSGPNRLGQWLSDAYSIISEVKSIATATAAADPPPASPPAPPSAVTSPNVAPTAPIPSASQLQPSPSASAGASLETISTPSSSVILSSSSSISSSRTPSTLSQSLTSAPGTTSSESTTDPTSAGSSSTVTAASSSAAASTTQIHHHHSNTLAIVLGVVFGLLALLLLALCLCFVLKRRRRRRDRIVSGVIEDESWRTSSQSQPMMAQVPPTGTYAYSISGPPNDSQHPAYRGMETGSTNPFVPIVPPPRRSGLNGRNIPDPVKNDAGPMPLGPDTGNALYDNEKALHSETQPRASGEAEKLLSGVAAAGVAGVAAGAIARKPIGSGVSGRSRTSSASGAVSPTDSPMIGHTDFGQHGHSPVSPVGSPVDAMGHPPSYDHLQTSATQPLMMEDAAQTGDTVANRPRGRPSTPLDFLAAGVGGAGLGAAAAHQSHRNDDSRFYSSSETMSNSRKSSESASAGQARSIGRASLDDRRSSPNRPSAQSRSPRRARFPDPVIPGGSHVRDASRTTSSSNESSQRGGNSPARPSGLRQSTDSSSESRTTSNESTYRLATAQGIPVGSGEPSGIRGSSRRSPRPRPTPHPGGRRLRLSDLVAEEEEMQRLRMSSYEDEIPEEEGGWASQRMSHGRANASTRGSDGNYGGYGYGTEERYHDDDNRYNVGRAL